ncbi:MAG: catalase [Bacilli bacterium]|nr:catalase [Bacilli bacterium]
MEYKITLKKFFGHLHTVNIHRFRVFKLSCKVGIPFQGLVHDLSKYHPEEFWESVKYYQGTYSPIRNCKMDIGYSKAWIRHKGRNKHHYEYWSDLNSPVPNPIMPFKYFLELVCDSYAAGMTYCKKGWTPEYQENYWKKVRNDKYLNSKMVKMLDEIYNSGTKYGLKKVFNRKYLKNVYDKYNK